MSKLQSLFVTPMFTTKVFRWKEKKDYIKTVIDWDKVVPTYYGRFYSDKEMNIQSGYSYKDQFATIFEEELQMCVDAYGLKSMSFKNVWTVRYEQHQYQDAHNHSGGAGLSGILYLDYDPEVHTPTKFIAPYNDYVSDCVDISYMKDVEEGTLCVFPSSVLHFVNPNQTKKERIVIAFDLSVEL